MTKRKVPRYPPAPASPPEPAQAPAPKEEPGDVLAAISRALVQHPIPDAARLVILNAAGSALAARERWWEAIICPTCRLHIDNGLKHASDCASAPAQYAVPEPEPEAMRERINELEVALRIQNDLALSRLAQANAANQIVAADWQEMKMLRAKAQAVVNAFRVDLRNGKWSDSLLEAMDNLRATLASSSSAPATHFFDKRAADALAREVQALIDRKVIDFRSLAADALLDYVAPGPTESVPEKLAASAPDTGTAPESLEDLMAEARAEEREARRFVRNDDDDADGAPRFPETTPGAEKESERE